MSKSRKVFLGISIFGFLGIIAMISEKNVGGSFLYFVICGIFGALFFLTKNKKDPIQEPAVEASESTNKSHKSTVNRNKGKNINGKYVSDYTIIDLETTGFSPKNDAIIEMSAIKVRNNEIVESFTTLVNPERNIPKKITKLTTITDEMVADAPTIQNVLKQFIDFIGSDIVVGHNVSFDINFVYDRCIDILNVNFSNDYIDTLYIARKKLPELEHHRLSDLVEHYNIDPGTAHRSLCDCETTYKLYQIFRQ